MVDGECVTVCPDGQWMDTNVTPNLCKDCSDDCERCVGPNTDDCTECHHPKMLSTNPVGKC